MIGNKMHESTTKACIRNSGFSGKSKVCAFNKSQYQTESEVLFNPLLLIHAKRCEEIPSGFRHIARRLCRPKPFQGLRTSEGFAKCKTLRKASGRCTQCSRKPRYIKTRKFCIFIEIVKNL